jgi:hypothetical protein
MLLVNFATWEEIKYIRPAIKRMIKSKEIEIETILFIFLFIKKLTNGFNKIAIIRANAKGTIMLLSTKSMYTKSMIPKSVTVDLKKNGYFFCISFQ